jgi:hypothetical protein
MSDFFTDDSGRVANFHGRRRRYLGAMLDPGVDLSLLTLGIGLIDRAAISRRVLAIGIEVPSRPRDVHNVLGRLQRSSRHSVDVSIVPMAEGLGKFANVERALSTANIHDYDWLLIVDDDIAFDNHMPDRLITLSEMAGLSISQPAHMLSSFATYDVTLRRFNSFVRETHFVEIGPLTAFRRDVFSDVIPFPPSRWCYGIDLVWSELARKKGFKMGIVDAAPVRHLRAIANSYNIDRARAEGETLVKTLDIPVTRAELLGFEKRVPIAFLKELAEERIRAHPQS